jgi:hypothetical protein
MKLFIERAGLGNCKMYNPRHPRQIKRYNLSLFASGQTNYMVSSVEFYNDYYEDRKNMKKLNNLETLFFINCVISPELYMNYMNLLQGRVNYVNKRTFREHNVIFFIPKISYTKMQQRLKSKNIYKQKV